MRKATGMRVVLALATFSILALAVQTWRLHNDAFGWLMLLQYAAIVTVFILAGYGIAYLTGHRREKRDEQGGR